MGNLSNKLEERTKIISVFSCLGKTYLAKKNKNVLDLEASYYKWIYNDKILAQDVEKRKGVKDRIMNPKYPYNYLKAIEENIGKYDVLLITPDKLIRNKLKENNISYIVAYPSTNEFLKERALKRGNNIQFAQGLENTFYRWYPEKEEVLWINETEYLEEVLKRERILNE